MSSSFRKLASNALVDVLGSPAETAWRNLSWAMLNAEGPRIYERALIPGFPETQGARVLYGGSEEDPMARFEDEVEARKKAKRGRLAYNYLNTLSKVSAEQGYEEGGRQRYWEESNPGGREYSLRRERDLESGIQDTWDQIGEKFYGDSKTPEPALLNQDNFNTSTPNLYKNAVTEPKVTESQTYSHVPGSDTQKRRAIDTLHAFASEQDPMSDEVTGPPPKCGALMPEHVWDSRHTQYNDEKTEHARLPGRKPVVRDAYDELNTNNVWDEHDAFMVNKGVMDHAANPGPAV